MLVNAASDGVGKNRGSAKAVVIGEARHMGLKDRNARNVKRPCGIQHLASEYQWGCEVDDCGTEVIEDSCHVASTGDCDVDIVNTRQLEGAHAVDRYALELLELVAVGGDDEAGNVSAVQFASDLGDGVGDAIDSRAE